MSLEDFLVEFLHNCAVHLLLAECISEIACDRMIIPVLKQFNLGYLIVTTFLTWT